MIFRRKYEFKPDRPQSGDLGKLYVTKKQRLTFLKWGLLALTMLVASLLQDVIMSRFSIFGTTTDLISCAIIIACIMQDPETGCVFGLVSSVLYYFSGTSPGAYVIGLLTGLGVVISIFRQCYLRRGFGSILVCTAMGLLIYELTVFLIGAFLGTIPWRHYEKFCITAGLSLTAVPVLYPIILSIGKIGGELWKE